MAGQLQADWRHFTVSTAIARRFRMDGGQSQTGARSAPLKVLC